MIVLPAKYKSVVQTALVFMQSSTEKTDQDYARGMDFRKAKNGSMSMAILIPSSQTTTPTTAEQNASSVQRYANLLLLYLMLVIQ